MSSKMTQRLSNEQIIRRIRGATSHWDVWPTFKDGHLNLPIATIHFIAFDVDKAAQKDPSADPSNHWGMVLAMPAEVSTDADEFPPGSVSIDAERGSSDTLQSSIKLKSNKYVVSRNAQSKYQASVPFGVSVATVISIVIANQRDFYQYHHECEGCSCWLVVVAQDLARAGIVQGADVKAAEEIMSHCWPKGNVRAIKPGTFDGEVTEQ